MPSIPLPLVIALLLLLLLVSLARQNARPAFLVLIAACALQSALLGLRWGYGVEWVRPILPVTAAAGPALVYASFGGLARQGSHRRRLWLHALPPATVALLVLFWRPAIDAALIALFLIYAAALVMLARAGPDGLDRARLEGAAPAYRALLLAAGALCASALVDFLVAIDLEWSRGAHAAEIVAVANLVGLVAIGIAGLVGGRSQPPAETAAPLAAEPSAADVVEDQAVFAAVEALITGRKLFRDPELSLDRLARRAGIPARRISGAINRTKGQNVSQYVNDHRIAEACRVLSGTDGTVTEAMFEAGFQTKSNFNREFRRVTGTSPSAWKRAAMPPPAETPLSKSAAMR